MRIVRVFRGLKGVSFWLVKFIREYLLMNSRVEKNTKKKQCFCRFGVVYSRITSM